MVDADNIVPLRKYVGVLISIWFLSSSSSSASSLSGIEVGVEEALELKKLSLKLEQLEKRERKTLKKIYDLDMLADNGDR